MKLYFKQRLFSWLDSYDIYDEHKNVYFEVKGELAWGHRLQVYDNQGYHLGTLQEKVFTFLPKFEIYKEDNKVGEVHKEFSFFTPKFNIDYNGWHIEGDFLNWDYDIIDANGQRIATISKELFHWTDTYVLEIMDERDALDVILVTLAIDAEKCSSNND